MIGIVSLGCLGIGTTLAGLTNAARDSAKIQKGDLKLIADYLSEDDLSEFAKKKEAVSPKAMGAVEPQEAQTTQATPTPTNTTQPPEPTSESDPNTTAPESAESDTAPDPTPTVDRLQWRDGEHIVWVGLSGAGKTTVIYESVPNTSQVIYITLKSEDKAPDDWQAYRLRKFADQGFLSQLDDLCSMLTGLVQAKCPHRLIIDEALTILDQAKDAQKTLNTKEDKEVYGAVAARFEGLLKMYIRMGRSDGHWLGLVTQSPNGTDLFGSAKTMQGLKIVLCAGEASSNRFDFVVAWAKQLYGQFVTPADENRLRSTQSGFWHFWLEGGAIQYRATAKSDRTLADIPMLTGYKSLVDASAATPDNPAAVDWSAIAQQLLQQPEGHGLRRAASTVTGRNLAGVTWQKWRDEFAAELRTLDPNLQDRLIEQFPAVLG